MAKKFLTGLKLVNLNSDPSVGSEGELYFNSSASVAKIYQAGAWSVLGAGGGGGSSFTNSAELAALINDETGFSSSAKAVFSISPTFTTSILGGTTFSAFTTTKNLTLGVNTNDLSNANGTNNILSGGTIETSSTANATFTDNYSVKTLNTIDTSNVEHIINIGTGAVTNNAGYAVKTINIGTGTVTHNGSNYASRSINIGNGTVGTGESTVWIGSPDNGSQVIISGLVNLSSDTQIGNVNSVEISYLDGVTSSIQTQLDSKVSSSSPTFTGTVQLGTSATFVVEGSSNDTFETTLTVANPNADRTITFPNASGTVALTDSSTVPLSAQNIQITVGAALATTGTVNLDFSTDGYKTQPALTGNVTYTASGYAAGRSVTVRVINGATLRTLTFPTSWVFLGTKPANIAASKTGVLTITSFGTTEANCVAAWSVQA